MRSTDPIHPTIDPAANPVVPPKTPTGKVGVGTASASLLSVLLSFIASSHHHLHMAILMVMGGSTQMMAGMGAMLWVRRFMIVMTFATVVFSIYRLYRHRCRTAWVIALTAVSSIASIYFIVSTLVGFGW